MAQFVNTISLSDIQKMTVTTKVVATRGYMQTAFPSQVNFRRGGPS